MPRVARTVIPNCPHHVTQRGNNRQDVFFVDDDLGDIWSDTVYYYDGQRVLAEYAVVEGLLQDELELERYFVDGPLYIDEHVMMHDATAGVSGADYYYLQQELYTVAGMVDVDGDLVEAAAYDAYGDTRIYDMTGPTPVQLDVSAIGNPYYFTGRRLDPIRNPYDTPATYRPLYHYRARAYDAAHGRFLQRDPAGYVDGMNLYEYTKSSPGVFVDPDGRVVVLIHGVNAGEGAGVMPWSSVGNHNVAWYSKAKKGLKAFWKKRCSCEEEIIEFKWGDWYAGANGHLGGAVTGATDNVAQIYERELAGRDSFNRPYYKYPRFYMMQAIARMRDLLVELNQIKRSEGSKEQISVIAHSQGTILTLGALQKGATLDNFIMMGSPLDVWEDGTGAVGLSQYTKDNDLEVAQYGIRGKTYNYWSAADEAVFVTGGIGVNGDGVAAQPQLQWVTNRRFQPGGWVGDFPLGEGSGDWVEGAFRHSDYMMRAEFFARIHGPDLGCSRDRFISKDKSISRLKNDARGGW